MEFRDSSNLVADRFRPYSITLFCSLAGRSPVRDQIPLRCSACDQLASWSQAGQRNGIWSRTGLRPASELDSVMKFGLRHAHDVHTQVFVQLLAVREPARELVADLLASWSQAGQRYGIRAATSTRRAHAGLRPAR